MKRFRTITILLVTVLFLSSCSLWNRVFPPKYDCPTNGKNIGAERVLDGDAKTQKALKKAKKFRS